MNKKEYWEEVQQKANEDDRVLGLFLGGSRGKSETFVRDASDYDVHFVVRDEAKPWFEKEYCGSHEAFDFVVQGYEEFREEDTPYWARYNFEHNHVIIDKADIQGLVDAKARIHEDHIDTFVERQLDGYINYVYRSLKCVRDDLGRAARLEANRSIDYGLKSVFAIHNGRTLPYYKYLEWELSKAGLEKFSLSAKTLLTILDDILDDADLTSQIRLYEAIEELASSQGYSDVFETWGDGTVNSWIKNFDD